MAKRKKITQLLNRLDKLPREDEEEPVARSTSAVPGAPQKDRPVAARKIGAETSPETRPAGEPLIVSDEILSPEEVQHILQERARVLAQIPPAEERGATAQVVMFTLGQEVYGIEATYVENIYPLEELTPVPCTPDFVLGVVNLRGRILSVIDLHRFLGLEGIHIDEETQVMAVSAAGLEIGLLANEVRAVVALPLEKLTPALPTTARVAAEYTRGVTPEMVVLLDLEALLRDRRMIVQEEA
jgi:purine-binding chemotaxis protein CheW